MCLQLEELEAAAQMVQEEYKYEQQTASCSEEEKGGNDDDADDDDDDDDDNADDNDDDDDDDDDNDDDDDDDDNDDDADDDDDDDDDDYDVNIYNSAESKDILVCNGENGDDQAVHNTNNLELGSPENENGSVSNEKTVNTTSTSEQRARTEVFEV